jgi:hypothetical protein
VNWHIAASFSFADVVVRHPQEAVHIVVVQEGRAREGLREVGFVAVEEIGELFCIPGAEGKGFAQASSSMKSRAPSMPPSNVSWESGGSTASPKVHESGLDVRVTRRKSA